MEQRLHFEMLLADVCADFINVGPDALDATIENAQRLICESLGLNHSSVWQVSEENPELLFMSHAYRDPRLKPLPSRPILRDYFPWVRSKVLNGEIISLPNTTKVPPEAAKDMESWRRYGVRSTLAFPLSVSGSSVIGLLAFDSTSERDWPEPLQPHDARFDARCGTLSEADKVNLPLPIHPGMSQSELFKTLGQPTVRNGSTLLYVHEHDEVSKNAPFTVLNTVSIVLRDGAVWAIEVLKVSMS